MLLEFVGALIICVALLPYLSLFIIVYSTNSSKISVDKMDAPMQPDPIWLFIATFLMSSFAGLASLLRSGKNISTRSATSAMLNSGLLGLAFSLIWYKYYFIDNIYFLVGISLLAGLGGNTIIDFVLEVLRNGGIVISLKSKNKGDKD